MFQGPAISILPRNLLEKQTHTSHHRLHWVKIYFSQDPLIDLYTQKSLRNIILDYEIFFYDKSYPHYHLYLLCLYWGHKVPSISNYDEMFILAHDFRRSKCIIVKKVKQSGLVSGLGSRRQLLVHIMADRKQKCSPTPEVDITFKVLPLVIYFCQVGPTSYWLHSLYFHKLATKC